MSSSATAAAADAKPKKDATAADTASSTSASKYPDMSMAQKMHRLIHHHDQTGEMMELESEVFEEIAMEWKNPSLYLKLQQTLHGKTPTSTLASAKFTKDELTAMGEANKKEEMEKLQEKVKEAEINAGDMEIMDAKIAIARYAAQCLTEDEALQAYDDVLALPKISSGKQLDLRMEKMRIASFYGDTTTVDDILAQIQQKHDSPDWDRRNRLRVYQALQYLLHRDLQQASKLLLDGIATFSCTEICSYQDFIKYACLTNLLHLPRVQLKKKVLDGPEVLSVSKEIPVVIQLVKSYYDCDYKAYLNAMVEVEDVLKADRYLYPHYQYWMRELHILAYKQFLDAYQSVTLKAMASAFGVSEDFIDYHASRFIAANRLDAKIDKYNGVIITNRPDLKNAQYREMIQKGDLLLNRIQKLARVVDL